MLVDSYKFLPRSFLPLYEDTRPLDGEDEMVWSPFSARLSDAAIALITSAGLSLAGEQVPFDLDRERREPTWGDPTHRVLPQELSGRALEMSHLHVNPVDILTDHNVALPVDPLADLVASGRVGRAVGSHVSVMGYQQAGLAGWRENTAPAIIDLLHAQSTDGVVLAPV